MTEEPDRPLRYRQPRQARSAATLARVLRAAEEIAASSGLEEMTMAGVAERAGVSVGTIYRRFEDKEQLITALSERMLERREEYMAEQLRTAEPSLSGVLDAYAHALLQSFADSNRLFPELLRTRGTTSLNRGARTITEIHRLLLQAAAPYTDQIQHPYPQQALDTAARAVLGACFHNSVRPDPVTGETARRQYADELADMAIAYLLTPDRRRTAHTRGYLSRGENDLGG
ncbi:TetR/AcrR family transcriptional regulator [Actinomadura opuntiae]|uniref:TetR/AcrR family transcriptional regulator n=1 Tax=Actinomadura sp. OS1-43 TaxID=604315 RepID=UPI00255AADDB|nr:TetR/AcrR family transcriptional regulator [Actinomadura sp. OS1-43]MDL4818572.1 TetR/AcrR family transcriptional regulator [Actinomadura sp. OS1-43]